MPGSRNKMGAGDPGKSQEGDRTMGKHWTTNAKKEKVGEAGRALLYK
jgi:hypothetical protein